MRPNISLRTLIVVEAILTKMENIALLAFATAQVSGLSIARSLTALLTFLVGAILDGRAMARASTDSQFRLAAQAFLLEVAFLFLLRRFAASDTEAICWKHNIASLLDQLEQDVHAVPLLTTT